MTSPAAERTLPIRVPILPSESLDSWLEALARRNQLPVSKLLVELGIRTPRAPVDLAARIPAAVLRRVESRTGLPAGRLDAATLDWFLPGGWVNLHGSRYCPACLGTSDGRWALHWRLTWTFACTTHRLLLPATCPTCRYPPRNGLAATRRILPPGTCPNRRGAARFCGTDLRTTGTVLLAADDPLLDGQRRIDGLLAAAGPASPDLPAVFTDLHILASWLLHHATEDDIADLGPHARHAWQARHQPVEGEPGGIPAFPGTALIGTSATLALALLSDDQTGAVSRLKPLLARAGRRRTRPSGMSQPQWRRLSPPVHARFLHAADPELGNTDRIRYRSCLPTARPPDLDPNMLDRRARSIPQLLWPEWTVRLLPADGFTSHTFRTVIAACLLLPGNPTHPLHQVTDRLHPHLTGQHITLTLRELAARGHQPVFTAICLLADHLDHHGSPIDYQRRRTAIPPILIDEEQWRQLCFRAGAHPGEDRRLLDAQRHLYQTLTGADLDDPAHTLAFRSSADRSAHLTFTASLTSGVRDGLAAHAAGHLRRLRITEPLTWHPPLDLAAHLPLPGREPADIDLDAVHQLAVVDGHPLGAVAVRLGTTIDHTRLALERVLRPPRDWSAVAPPAAWQHRQRARSVLTRAFFDREYIAAGKTLTQIADETGYNRRLVGQLAREAGIIITNLCEPVPIDEGWLRQQYLERKRSYTDIATELGVRDMTIIERARRYGIPSRPPGITSRPELLHTLSPDIPVDVRRAVEGSLAGWHRLHRFQIAMAFPTINAAADHLGAHQAALVRQFQHLERDIGAPLFHRATHTQPQRPTARGAALLRALARPDIRTKIENSARP